MVCVLLAITTLGLLYLSKDGHVHSNYSFNKNGLLIINSYESNDDDDNNNNSNNNNNVDNNKTNQNNENHYHNTHQNQHQQKYYYHHQHLSISNSSWRQKPVINEHKFSYIHNPKNVCKNKSFVVEVLIAVPVSAHAFQRRRIVRETWGQYATHSSNKAVLLFFLGASSENSDRNIGGNSNHNNSEGYAVGRGRNVSQSSLKSGQSLSDFLDPRKSRFIQQKIDEEFVLFGDIVQEDFIDNYRNLSLKTISILKWAEMYCHQRQYLIKADADIYVKITELVENLRKVTRAEHKNVKDSGFILGNVVLNANVYRDVSSKWYISKLVYPSDKYPPFTSGPLYALSSTAVARLYESSLRIELFPLEDVYVTGFCAHNSGVQHVQGDNFGLLLSVFPTGCSFITLTCSHSFSIDEIKQIHSDLRQSSNRLCFFTDFFYRPSAFLVTLCTLGVVLSLLFFIIGYTLSRSLSKLSIFVSHRLLSVNVVTEFCK